MSARPSTLPRTPACRRAGTAIGGERQRGSMAITIMLMMLGLVVILGLVEVGYLYWAKRDAQKVADLAALAGAQRLELCASDNSDNGAARSNAAENGFVSGEDGKQVDIACGDWDPLDNTAEDHFYTAPEPDTVNAVKVVATRPAIPIFGQAFAEGELVVSASAVAAKKLPIASFTVGSKLLNTGSGVLTDLLKGIGLDLAGTDLVGYDGLANVNITPAGLLDALDIKVPANISVGGLNQFLAAELRVRPLIDVLNATVELAGENYLLAANTNLLNAITAKLGISNLLVQMGDSETKSGLFAQINAPSAQQALGVELNALDVVYAAIGVATQNHAISVDNLSIPNILTGSGKLVEVKVAVIEPPSLGIGGLGAQAYTGQIRTYVNVDTGSLTIPLLGVNVQVKLPLMLDLVTGKGTITELCEVPDTLADNGMDGLAKVRVDASIAKICVGKHASESVFSTVASCDEQLQNEQILDIRLLNTQIAGLNTQLTAAPLSVTETTDPLASGDTQTVPQTNPLNLGTTVEDLVNDLLLALIAKPYADGVLNQNQINSIAQSYWDDSSSVCTASNPTCRGQRMNHIEEAITSSTAGLSGFLGSTVVSTLGLVNDLLTLNIFGVLTQLGNVVGGVLDLVVNDVLGNLLGFNRCTGWIFGSDSGCIQDTRDLLNAHNSDTNNKPTALFALLGGLFDLISPILDSVGGLLSSLLNSLGINLGQVDVNMRSVDCNNGAQLVY